MGQNLKTRLKRRRRNEYLKRKNGQAKTNAALKKSSPKADKPAKKTAAKKAAKKVAKKAAAKKVAKEVEAAPAEEIKDAAPVEESEAATEEE